MFEPSLYLMITTHYQSNYNAVLVAFLCFIPIDMSPWSLYKRLRGDFIRATGYKPRYHILVHIFDLVEAWYLKKTCRGVDGTSTNAIPYRKLVQRMDLLCMFSLLEWPKLLKINTILTNKQPKAFAVMCHASCLNDDSPWIQIRYAG